VSNKRGAGMNKQAARQLAAEVKRQGGGEEAVGSVFAGFINRHPAAPRLQLMQFFETFRGECDRNQRKKLGVYFTPPELAAYVTRCAMSLVQQCGAGPPVWLDPACGSGVFLHTVSEQLAAANRAARQHTAANVLGIELLPATAATARLLTQHHGVNVLNLNPLLQPHEELQPLLINGGPLVVIGNPPYSSRSAHSKHPAVVKMLAPYRAGVDHRKVNLSDDFIQFIRWSQLWIERAGSGVLAMVTSSTYLDGLTQKAMRKSLLNTFDQMHVLDLGGSILRQQTSPPAPGQPRDENVFGVRSGIAVGLFVKHQKRATARTDPQLMLAQLTGTRAAKLQKLQTLKLHETPWQPIQPQPPAFAFTQQPQASSQYNSWLPLDQIFAQYISGVQTKNDALLVAMSRDELISRLQPQFSDFDPRHIHPYITAPFDTRFVYYDRARIGRPRWRVARHLLAGGGGMLFMRQNRGETEYNHFLATPHLASDRAFYSAHGAPYMAPLMLHTANGLQPNATAELMQTLAACNAVAHLAGQPLLMWRQFVCWMYAVFHSQSFRQRFHLQLSEGFPRTPLPHDQQQFTDVSRLGAQLWRLHIAAQQPPPADTPPGVSSTPDCAGYCADDRAGQPPSLSEASSCISSTAMQCRVGGYAVLPRWIKQREATPVTTAMLTRLRAIAATLEETVRIQQEIAPYIGPFVS